MQNEIVLDIETQNTFADVDNDFKKLRVSVVSVFRYETGAYESFMENELPKLWPLLERAERIIGYNSEHFDLPILNNYYAGDLSSFAHLDIMKKVKEAVGSRLKLNDLAEATLDSVSKSADGLKAVQWWREGQIDEIKKYCEQDVRITKELYEFGRKNKHLFYKNLTGAIMPFAVNFEPAVPADIALADKGKINLTLPL